MECGTAKLESEIYGITYYELQRFKKDSFIQLIQFKAWWQAIYIQKLLIMIE